MDGGWSGPPYKVMTLDEIRAVLLPSAPEGWCWLWTTNKFLPVAFEILAEWGYTYTTTFVWAKSGGPQKPNKAQHRAEFVLLGRKGSPLFLDTKEFYTVLHAPRTGHSRKPDEFFKMVRRVCGGPRLSMFERYPREGFGPWGAEAPEPTKELS